MTRKERGTQDGVPGTFTYTDSSSVGGFPCVIVEFAPDNPMPRRRVIPSTSVGGFPCVIVIEPEDQ